MIRNVINAYNIESASLSADSAMSVQGKDKIVCMRQHTKIEPCNIPVCVFFQMHIRSSLFGLQT